MTNLKEAVGAEWADSFFSMRAMGLIWIFVADAACVPRGGQRKINLPCSITHRKKERNVKSEQFDIYD